MNEEPEAEGQLELSPDEKAQIAELLQSEAFKAIEKVWKWQTRRLRDSCVSAKEDQRFIQGYTQGFVWAKDILLQAIKVKQQSRAAMASADERVFNRGRA